MALRRLATAPQSANWYGVVAYDRYRRAQFLRALGALDESMRWYGTFDAVTAESLIYAAPAHYARGEILERLGRPAEAVRDYERVIALWADCDPELRPVVAEARRRVEQLRARAAVPQPDAWIRR